MVWTEAVEVEEKLTKFISEAFLAGNRNIRINSGTSLLGNRIVDSLGILEMIEFMEREFGITVEETEMIPENLDSIEKMTRFVKVKTEG